MTKTMVRPGWHASRQYSTSSRSVSLHCTHASSTLSATLRWDVRSTILGLALLEVRVGRGAEGEVWVAGGCGWVGWVGGCGSCSEWGAQGRGVGRAA